MPKTQIEYVLLDAFSIYEFEAKTDAAILIQDQNENLIDQDTKQDMIDGIDESLYKMKVIQRFLKRLHKKYKNKS